jgi:hypothetical protein
VDVRRYRKSAAASGLGEFHFSGNAFIDLGQPVLHGSSRRLPATIDRVKLEVYLHRLLPVVSILAALGPGISVWKMIRAPDVAKTITQYGPLPEIHVPTIDYITLAIVIVLFTAALLEAIRVRAAAPIILVTSVFLWVHYIPPIWDEISGTMWFGIKLAQTLGVSWQMLTYQTLTMLSAAILTYLRFNRPAQ